MLDKQDIGNECSKQGKSSTQNRKNITISQMDVFSSILGEKLDPIDIKNCSIPEGEYSIKMFKLINEVNIKQDTEFAVNY